MTTSHRRLAVFTGVNAVAAWGGAIGLVAGYLTFGDKINHRLPFASPVFAGFALALVVAIPLSVVTHLAWNRHEETAAAATVCGLLLVGWIAVQIAVIREFSFFQPFYSAVGAGLVVWGRRHRLPVDESAAGTARPPSASPRSRGRGHRRNGRPARYALGDRRAL